MPEENTPSEQIESQETTDVVSEPLDPNSAEGIAAAMDDALGANDAPLVPEDEPNETAIPEEDDGQDEEQDESADEPGEEEDSESGDSTALDEALLRQAEQLGLDTTGVGSDAELQRIVNAVNRRFMSLANPPTDPQQPTKPQEPVPVVDDEPEFELPEDLDEEIAKPVKQVVEYANKRYKKAEEKAQQLENAVRSFQIQQAADRFDNWVANLGDDYHEVFGKGSQYDVDKKGLENRVKLFKAADALATAYQRQGIQVPLTEIYVRAMRAEFADVGKQAESKRIQQQQNKRKRVTTAPPNRRAGKAPVKTPKQNKGEGSVEDAIKHANRELARIRGSYDEEDNPLAL